MSNDESVAQRRAGGGEAQVDETQVNNIIYIGRASFRMELAPLDLEDEENEEEDENESEEQRTDDGSGDGGEEAHTRSPLIVYGESDDDLPALVPRTGVAQLVSAPVTISRGRLAAWGALAFAIGLWVSIGASRLGGAGAAAVAPLVAAEAVQAPETVQAPEKVEPPPEIVALDSIAAHPATAAPAVKKTTPPRAPPPATKAPQLEATAERVWVDPFAE